MFDLIPLGDLAKIEMGQSPDSNYVHEGADNGLPFLQGNAEFGELRPSAKYSCSAPMKTCSAGDILISVRAPVGEINIADRSYCIGRGLAAISFSDMSPSIGGKLVEAARHKLRVVAQGSTFEAINKSDLLGLLIAKPHPKELEVLDAVFSEIDTQIRQTEVILAKLQQVKQGLLYDLLTRGIDANGQLRPPRDHAPELYKESPLGWIPREWEVASLERLVSPNDQITYGIVQAGPHVENGIPYIRTGDMKGDELQKEGMLCTSEKIARSFKRSEVRAGEIVFAIRATIGKVLMVPEELDGANLTQGTARISPADFMNNKFLFWCLKSESVCSQLSEVQKGTTFQEITLAQLRKLQVPYPADIDEQRSIASILEANFNREKLELSRLQKLKKQKSGLMDDLLTGRVRVTSLLDTAKAS